MAEQPKQDQDPKASAKQAVTEEPMGKVSNADQAVATTKPEKIKCDKSTSCDATLPWGSWEN